MACSATAFTIASLRVSNAVFRFDKLELAPRSRLLKEHDAPARQNLKSERG